MVDLFSFFLDFQINVVVLVHKINYLSKLNIQFLVFLDPNSPKMALFLKRKIWEYLRSGTQETVLIALITCEMVGIISLSTSIRSF